MKSTSTTLTRGLPRKQRPKDRVLLRLEHIKKTFLVGKRRVEVLKGIDLDIHEGEMAIIYGPSGCGKSTMLHTMLGLEEPDAGKVYLDDKCLYYLNDDERSIWRRDRVGIIFQQSNWIKSLNVWENVAYPLFLSTMLEREVKYRALVCLEKAGVIKLALKRPMDLSGGEQQKVQLARALVTQPAVLVADEPTGNLDSVSSQELIKLLVRLNRTEGKTIVMVTHDDGFLPLATRQIEMKDGKVVEDRHD